METLFPLKIDIPDINTFQDSALNFFNIINDKKRLNFLFANDSNIIKISEKNNIYPLGEIKKDDKIFSIYYIEIYDRIDKDIEIKILDNSFWIKADDTKHETSFLFDESFLDKNKKKIKTKFFDIYEEFEIYYRIHKEKNNINSLKLLISSTLYFLKANKIESNFTLFLTLFIKEHSRLIKDINIDDILTNMKNKGDLKRIPHEELYKIALTNKQNKIYMEIYLIYIILSQKTESINALLKEGYLNEQLIFYCLKKYEKLFSNSVQVFPKFAPLLTLANSFDIIKSILKCSKDLRDFIYFINEEKELILKYIDEKNCLRIEDFFDLKWAFTQQFDEDYYLVLNNIREFEIKFKKKFFVLDVVVEFSLKYENIKSMIFIWRMEEKEKKLLYNIISKHKFSKYIHAWMEEMNYNNFEIIEIIDELTNYVKIIDINNIEPFIILLQGIRFEKLNKKMKPFFSKILNNIFKKTIKDSFEKCFMDIVKNKVNDLKKIDDLEYICICTDKLIEKEKEKETEIEKEKGKEKDLNINENWIELIVIISNKYLTLLNEIKNEEIENENEFAEITSKLIYLNYKYGIKKEPLFSDKIGTKLLNNIYIIFLDKYVISDLFFEKLIIDLITKRKFGIIYNKLVGKEYISKFKKLLNKSIIEFDELFEENNFNILLLDIAYKNKFFESFKISSYTKNTIEKLKTIGNRIININNISLNQMEFLLKEKNLINFFSLIDEPFKDNINENLQKNISEIKSIIQIENLDEIEHQKLKFSSRNEIVDSIEKIIKKLKNEKLQG